MLIQARQFPKRHKRIGMFPVILTVLCGTYFAYLFPTPKKEAQSIITPLTDDFLNIQNTQLPTESPIPLSPTPLPTETQVKDSSDTLTRAVEDALIGTKGNYGVVIENYNTGETYIQNEHQEFLTGSLYKLWVMATVFQLLEENKLSLSETLSDTVEQLNAEFFIDPEYAELTTGSIQYSVNEALIKMITVSDNYAALLLTKRITLSRVQKFLTTYGFNESHVGTNTKGPTTTAYDMAKFLKLLFTNKLGNQTSTAIMMRLLSDQKLNDKLPRYLPSYVQLAHKTGELDTVSHDIGIVTLNDMAYSIIVLSESDSPDLANTRIANISKNAFLYFLHTHQE